MIDPTALPDGELSRIVYLTMSAASTALRAHGVHSPKLYASNETPLSDWGARSRGNLLMLLRLGLATIRESDNRRGVSNARGRTRFFAARICMEYALRTAPTLPAGKVTGPMPLKPVTN